MKDKTSKRTLDFPDELYHLVMEYGSKHKTYKFGPALIKLVNEFLESKNG